MYLTITTSNHLHLTKREKLLRTTYTIYTAPAQFALTGRREIDIPPCEPD